MAGAADLPTDAWVRLILLVELVVVVVVVSTHMTGLT